MPNPQPSQTPADSSTENEPVRLGDRLIEAGLITRSELDSTLDWLRENGLSKRRLGRTLVELGFLSDRELTKILGVHFGMPVAPFPVFDAEQAALKAVPAEFARKHRVVPCRLFSGSLFVAAPGPLQPEVVNELGRLTKHSVLVYLASEREVEAGLAKFYPERGPDGAKETSAETPATAVPSATPAEREVVSGPGPAEKIGTGAAATPRPAAPGPVVAPKLVPSGPVAVPKPLTSTTAGPGLLSKTGQPTLQARADKPASTERPTPVTTTSMSETVKNTNGVKSSDLVERARRSAAQTHEIAAALQRIIEDNERLTVDAGNLEEECETLRQDSARLQQDNARLQQDVDRARDENVRLREEVERARQDKEQVLTAVRKFADETLARHRAP
jgi:Type II secretion system (T2SS), protein E, N-terminal domain